MHGFVARARQAARDGPLARIETLSLPPLPARISAKRLLFEKRFRGVLAILEIGNSCRGLDPMIVRSPNHPPALPIGLSRSRVLTTSALASLSAVSAHAQSADEEEALHGTIDEIIVSGQKEFFRPTDASSATKFNLPIFDTPQSISVVTSDLIDSARHEDQLQVDKYVAGVYSLGEATTGTAYFGGSGFLNARGFSFDVDNGFKINGFSTHG